MKDELNALAECSKQAQDVETALLLAQCYGSMCWAVNVGVYDNPGLEQHLTLRFEAEIGHHCVELARKNTVHVVSEPYLTGGHTRLMETLAGMHDSPPDLLVTRQSNPEVRTRLSKFFSQIESVESLSGIERVKAIVNILAYYDNVVLHVHPDDIHTIVACGLAKRRSAVRIYFVNHADHTFTFGSSVADVYFEISSHGRRVDDLKNIHGLKSFLGIPVRGARRHADVSTYLGQPLIFVAAGSDIKFKPRKGHDIRPLIVALLKRFPKSEFKVIGVDLKTNFWWWLLKLRFPVRFKALRNLPVDQYSEYVKQADFFVDSHPFPGGTAFAEQLLSGKNVIGLRSPFQGYSPAEKLKSASVEDVLSTIPDYKISQTIIEEVMSVNGYEAVKDRYLGCLYGFRTFTNLNDEFSAWDGDLEFNEVLDGGRAADVPVAAFIVLVKNKPKLAVALFLRLSFTKKIKIFAKCCLALVRALRAAKNNGR